MPRDRSSSGGGAAGWTGLHVLADAARQPAGLLHHHAPRQAPRRRSSIAARARMAAQHSLVELQLDGRPGHGNVVHLPHTRTKRSKTCVETSGRVQMTAIGSIADGMKTNCMEPLIT